MLSNADGSPVAVEVFEGRTGEPKTVAGHRGKLRQRFEPERVVLVGDRGMLTARRIEEDLALTRALFAERDLAEVRHPDYPGERLIVCRNPLVAAQRARQRGELIAAAEKKLQQIEAATKRKRQPVRSAEKINCLVGQPRAASQVAKYFRWQITPQGFGWERNRERIERDAAQAQLGVVRQMVRDIGRVLGIAFP